ncbi:hypothetical protein EYY95_18610 [Hafnia alvei]|jgi:hypothetical protein|uniref:hypothetical protein n=1 Tax=Hafnia TaxID=568 RepID=UPI000BBA95B4|nr:MULTISPECIES: hypothetical protein [Hafnia]QIP54912.1 hypothetical protein HBA19_04405 [Hafnia alvei]TBL84039.1 hypothetical protein EYY95_18610 [Hafnia alvei]
MNQLRKDFIAGLSERIRHSYTPSIVARYALEFYLDHDVVDSKLEYVINYLRGIDAGPQFELSKKEVIHFIENELTD